MTTAYLFCYNLFNNLVKARQVENITNSTKLVVNFRRLKLEQVTLSKYFNIQIQNTFKKYAWIPPTKGIWLTWRQAKCESQEISQNLGKLFNAELRCVFTRGLNTTLSIPRRPKSEIFAGIPFTFKKKRNFLLTLKI